MSFSTRLNLSRVPRREGLALIAVVGLFLALADTASAQFPGDLRAAQPVLITSSGQSPDAQLVKLILDQVGIPAQLDILAEADEWAGYQTLVVGIGGSMKGLGAAGIDTDQEVARVDRLIARARSEGAFVLAIHIGGQARRGSLADPFIHGAVPKADAVIVYSDGNKDGLFNRLVEPDAIPLVEVASIAEVGGIVASLFGVR